MKTKQIDLETLLNIVADIFWRGYSPPEKYFDKLEDCECGKVCVWEKHSSDKGDYWTSDCHQNFTLQSSDIENINHCLWCGKKINESE